MRYSGSGTTRHVSRLAIAAASLAVPLGMTAPAVAQQAPSEAEQDFAIPAGPLAQALQAYSAATGIQLVYSSDLVAGANSPGVTGHMARTEALGRLLAGTGLTAGLSGNSATIRRVTANAGERVLGAVRIEGAQGSSYFGGAGVAAGVNGINGSRDITATEGTKSFTSGALTIGSKVPQAMKDVPQSVSVLTSERLEQQHVTDFTSAMQQLPGITLVQGATSLENKFYSRGFQITSIQVDGGAPLTTIYDFYPQIDMSVYDHVELVRGANGLFDGYGDPSGTVNLVRKKPLDHAQVLLEGQAGSWSNYRTMIDATAPLALDGRLRGRLVMTWQDQDHFYKVAKDRKTLIYGITEFDATPTTLLTAGLNYTRQNSLPWYNGLPRYITGADLKLPRSTCLCFPWNRWDFDTTEIFGGLEQKIADAWKLKVNLTHNRQKTTKKLGYSYGAVNPLTGIGPRLLGLYRDSASTQFSAEAVLTGAFTIFGQRQEITIGANRASSNASGGTVYDDLIYSDSSTPYQPYPGGPIFCFGGGCPAGTIPPATPPINVFNFNPNDLLFTEPANPLPVRRYVALGVVQTGAYASLRLTAFDRLHLTTGLRWSRYQYKNATNELCEFIPTSGTPRPGNCVGKNVGDTRLTQSQTYHEQHFDWPPPVNVSFDVTKQLTAYAGYTYIYKSQANLLTSDNKPIAPLTGSNVEAGLKWAPRDGKLNFSLSAYRIRQKGFGIPDPSVPVHQVTPNIYCCYLADPNATFQSEGVDIEATGEILPGWQVAASYNFNNNKKEGSSFSSTAGQPFTSIQPKNLYKLWTSYDFGAAGHGGPLSGLTISGGINGQSSAFYSGSICVNPKNPPPPPGNNNTCASNSPPNLVPYAFTVPGYVVATARIDYQFSPKWSLAVNVENIFDKTYYQTVGGDPTGGNWYGAPRSVTVSVRGKW